MHCGSNQSVSNAKHKPKLRGNGMGTVYKRGKTWTAEVTCGKKLNPKTGKEILDRRKKGGVQKKSDAMITSPSLKRKGKRSKSGPRQHWQSYGMATVPAQC